MKFVVVNDDGYIFRDAPTYKSTKPSSSFETLSIPPYLTRPDGWTRVRVACRNLDSFIRLRKSRYFVLRTYGVIDVDKNTLIGWAVTTWKLDSRARASTSSAGHGDLCTREIKLGPGRGTR